MEIDAFGRVINIDAPEAVGCTACDGRAERLSSAWQGEGTVYHNYRCRDDECPAGGTLVEHDEGNNQRVGPVFHAPHTHHEIRRADHPAEDGPRSDEQAVKAREVRA